MSRAEREVHRRVAVTSFNRAWNLLEKKRRNPREDLEMLHLAHASRYHWGLVGTPKNRAVGEWQLSRVYAELGQPSLALRFARAALSTCEKNGLTDILPTAYEAIARAYAAANDSRRAKEFLTRARRRLEKSALDEEDRRIYLAQIRDTQSLIDRL